MKIGMVLLAALVASATQPGIAARGRTVLDRAGFGRATAVIATLPAVPERLPAAGYRAVGAAAGGTIGLALAVPACVDAPGDCAGAALASARSGASIGSELAQRIHGATR